MVSTDQIARVVEAAIANHTFPGAVVGYSLNGQILVLPFGNLRYDSNSPQVTKDTIYDLASLTKVIPTNSIILKLVEQNKISLDDKAIDFIPELENKYREQVQIKHLLTYTAVFDLPQRLVRYAPGGANAILKAIYKTPLKYQPGTQYLYSNAPIILLGRIAEKIVGKRLDEIGRDMFFNPLGMSNTTFHPKELDNSLIPPTEVDGDVEIQGVVHDETARALYQAGVISGNAGLFSTAKDLLIFGQMLLAGGEYKGRRYFKESTVEAMHSNQIPKIGSATGLGWDIQQPDFMGTKISSNSFGKTGFTGVSVVIDPDKNACLVILSNRTYPKRPPTPEGIMKVRASIADLVFG